MLFLLSEKKSTGLWRSLCCTPGRFPSKMSFQIRPRAGTDRSPDPEGSQISPACPHPVPNLLVHAQMLLVRVNDETESNSKKSFSCSLYISNVIGNVNVIMENPETNRKQVSLDPVLCDHSLLH